MKQHFLGSIMVGFTGLMVLIVVGLCYTYVQDVRKSRRLQGELFVATVNRNRAQALAADAQEFAKKNKQMDSLLQSLNRPPGGTSTNAARPITRSP